MKKPAYVFLTLIILTLAVGCGASGETTTPVKRDYWPTEGWQTSTPEEQNMDSAKLDKMMEFIDEADLTIFSVVVVRHGYIVLEEYPDPFFDRDWKWKLHSVTKSFTSALIGIAIEKGFIDSVEQKVIDFFPDRTIANLDSQKQNMTLEHLLTMTSGLDWDEHSFRYGDPRNSLAQMVRSRRPTQFMLDLPMASEPGEDFLYNTGASYLLSAIITETTGQDTFDFAREFLFEPLGITDVKWANSIEFIPYGGSELHLTPRDMAKFGYLYLNNGIWDGKQIVPTDWVAKSTETHVFLTESGGYGYHWWTLPKNEIYYASGLYEQKIYVIPDLDMVVAFTAGLKGWDPEPLLLHLFIIAACENQ